MQISLLQPTCIVGTKTYRGGLLGSSSELQPTCIVGTKTIMRSSSLRYYNPRASWVLKLENFFHTSKILRLQPTCIVGTKTYSMMVRFDICELQPTYIVGTKTFMNLLSFIISLLQPTYIAGTKTILGSMDFNCFICTTAHVYHGGSKPKMLKWEKLYFKMVIKKRH